MSTDTASQKKQQRTARQLGWLRRIPRLIFIAPIRFYQRVISPFRGPSCRFYPSCSQYALTALQKHGVFRGLYLGTRRLLRCHPWNPGGVDHVP